MRSRGLRRTGNALLAVAAVTIFVPASAQAQAWVPLAGQGNLQIAYQAVAADDYFVSSSLVDGEVVSDPRRVVHDDMDSRTAMLLSEYGITDRLCVSFGAAYVSARYTGDRPHPGVIDDGSWNSGFQDLNFGLRYQLVRAPFALTPFVSTGVPSSNYVSLGHSAIGRNLKELRLGASAGWVMTPLLSDLFVQGSYSYAFVEDVDIDTGEHGHVDSISTDRSDFDFQLGYFVSPSLVVSFQASHMLTHDGIETGAGRAGLGGTQAHFDAHDQALRAVATRVGFGASYNFTPQIGIFASYLTTVDGENTRAAKALSVGANWNFSTPFARMP